MIPYHLLIHPTAYNRFNGFTLPTTDYLETGYIVGVTLDVIHKYLVIAASDFW